MEMEKVLTRWVPYVLLKETNDLNVLKIERKVAHVQQKAHVTSDARDFST